MNRLILGSKPNEKNLAVINFNPIGKINWSQKIGKNTTKYSNSYFSSAITLNLDSALYLIYYDNLLNLERRTEPFKRAFRGKNEALVCARVTNDGTIEKFVIATKEELDGFRVRTDVYQKMDDGQIILFAQDPVNAKKQRFITVMFKK